MMISTFYMEVLFPLEIPRATRICEIKLQLMEKFHKKYNDLHFLHGGILSSENSACC